MAPVRCRVPTCTKTLQSPASESRHYKIDHQGFRAVCHICGTGLRELVVRQSHYGSVACRRAAAAAAAARRRLEEELEREEREEEARLAEREREVERVVLALRGAASAEELEGVWEGRLTLNYGFRVEGDALVEGYYLEG